MKMRITSVYAAAIIAVMGLAILPADADARWRKIEPVIAAPAPASAGEGASAEGSSAEGASAEERNAEAGNSETTFEGIEIAKGAFIGTPQSTWNASSKRPSSHGETWSKNGLYLNRLDFFGRIAPGDALFKERDGREHPLPPFAADMHLADLADLFESSFRANWQVTRFQYTSLAPAKLGGEDAVMLSYEIALAGGHILRRGEARMAVKDGQLYLVNFTAPRLYYFDRDIGEARAIMGTVQLR